MVVPVFAMCSLTCLLLAPALAYRPPEAPDSLPLIANEVEDALVRPSRC